MKKAIGILLTCALLSCMLTGCGRGSVTPENGAAETASGNFDPETTAAASDGGLTQAVENGAATDAPTQAVAQDTTIDAQQPEVVDTAITQSPDAAETAAPQGDAAAEPTAGASASPQNNVAISGYSTVTASELGFSFSYPVNWTNQPGRSTICFTQPVTDSGVYSARVAVTMKKIAHDGNEARAKEQLVSYIQNLMTQYDQKTFEVGTLDTSTKFMGQNAWATTYLAYDDTTEIKGYVILTYYTKYVFVYHFLCAYDDYAGLESSMRFMRDSVQPVQSGS